MSNKPPIGLFVTGTDTEVGKTYVAAMIARALAGEGLCVGVYKPVASGCVQRGDALVSDDAVALWKAACEPGELERVCPQRFEPPLAPHLAAQAEGMRVDRAVLREGLDYWRERSDIVIVEGVGGLMSPLNEDEYVADLAEEFGFPLVLVARNTLGTIHQTLATLIVAATFRDGLDVSGIVLNEADDRADDASRSSNADEIARRCVPPLLASVAWGQAEFDAPIDWMRLAGRR